MSYIRPIIPIMHRQYLLIFFFALPLFSQTKIASFPGSNVSGNGHTLFGAAAKQNLGRPDSLVSYIVEFREEPLAVRQKSVRGMADVSFYSDRLAEFSRRTGLTRKGALNRTQEVEGSGPEYFRTFFGLQVTVSPERAEQLARLPYVKRVHPDLPVRATLEKSALQIGANRVWTELGETGDGVKVGIIDSGIDYLHPALGEGFGSGKKVAGGFDFVNNDADPMDDYGHGTHVAAIVAGNSASLKGVAPGATLYAYKVLNNAGNGKMSDILAAVERCVDPNGDGDTGDRLDVVNMSLGSDGGTPDDPGAVAVNNAVAFGTLFVVAAGNAGQAMPPPGKENNYYHNGSATIGSPGTAERAITVGAVDSVEALAWFSSKGPNLFTFGIKPDVVAPGVQINSAYPGAQTKRMNGTSMAAPMVAGVAALLKGLHPGWSTERFRSAIINTARDGGMSAYKQGGGRVRAFHAASVQSWLQPALLSLGLDDPSQGTWTRKDTVTVMNERGTAQSYTIVVPPTPTGVALSAVPSNFIVPAGGSVPVVITTSVNNTVVPLVPEDIPLYSGRIIFLGSADTLTSPWAFARANRLLVHFDTPEPQLIGTDGEHALFFGPNVRWLTPTTMEVVGFTPGSYDISAFFPSTERSSLVIREGVTIGPPAPVLNISSVEATVPVIFKGVDHLGAPLSSYRAPKHVLVTEIPNWGKNISVAAQRSDTVMVSPASARYSFRPMQFQFDAVQTGRFHLVQYPRFTALNSAVTLKNDPLVYVPQAFRFRVPPEQSSTILVGQFYSYFQDAGGGYLYGAGFEIDTAAVQNGRADVAGYIGRSGEPAEDAAVSFFLFNDGSLEKTSIETFPVMVHQDSVIPIDRYNVRPQTPRFGPGSVMEFGASPPHPLTLWYNNSFGEATLHFNAFTRGPLWENRWDDVNHGTYTVYDQNGAPVVDRPLNDFPRAPRQMTEQRYMMVQNISHHWVSNRRGTLRQRSSFDLGGTSPYPPSITRLMLVNAQNVPVSSFAANSGGALVFSTKVIGWIPESVILPESAAVWYRHHGTAAWTALPVTALGGSSEPEGAMFRAPLTAALATDSIAIDLRIRVREEDGDVNEVDILPAFAVGNWVSSDPNGVIDEPAPVPHRFALEQNYPNPFNPSTTISYVLPHDGLTSLTVYDALGREAAELVNEFKSTGRHTVSFDASRLSSGVYFYRLSAGKFTATRKLMLVK